MKPTLIIHKKLYMNFYSNVNMPTKNKITKQNLINIIFTLTINQLFKKSNQQLLLVYRPYAKVEGIQYFLKT